ncbi:hypothetical protein RB653_003578 [Dictyostelium firmibasis]|uniref:Uncharacterized protein n=1 Tax=Dictyostelium firmibasis TaxID=79012 RepID=A0AAN7U504_9MYCE
MKFLISLILLISTLSFINASINVKYGSCQGSCSCASNMIENYETSEALEVVKIPNYPESVSFSNLFNASWNPSTNTISFVETGSFSIVHEELKYPINVSDNSYNVPQCAYQIRSSSSSCFYQVLCNTDQAGTATSFKTTSLIFSIILIFSLLLL